MLKSDNYYINIRMKILNSNYKYIFPTLGSKIEPAMPRRKKHPELAYRVHEFYGADGYGTQTDTVDNVTPFDRARVNIKNPIHISHADHSLCINTKFTSHIYTNTVLNYYIRFIKSNAMCPTFAIPNRI